MCVCVCVCVCVINVSVLHPCVQTLPLTKKINK